MKAHLSLGAVSVSVPCNISNLARFTVKLFSLRMVPT